MTRGKLKLMLLLITLFLVAVFAGKTVFADPGGVPWGCGYFNGACGYSTGFQKIIPEGISATTDKNTFISDIEWYLNNGDYHRKSGAAFVIQRMRGNVNRVRPPSAAEIQDWKNRIHNSDISLSVENKSYDWNSGWHDVPQDNFSWNEPDTRQSIVFRHMGVIVFVIKIDCANPLEDVPGLPQQPDGIVKGRIFRDDNGNGSRESSEPLIQNPNDKCGAYLNVPVTITILGIGNTRPELCNLEPHYAVTVPGGTYNLQINPPPGWTVTSPNPGFVTVPPGNEGHLWFGIKRDITVRGRVFDWATQLPGGGLSGVQIETCGAGVVPTDANGFYSFQRPYGEGFCVRVVGGGPGSAAGPYIRPWSNGYAAQSPACPGFNSSPVVPMVDHGGAVGPRNFCKQPSYECQMAGVHQNNPFPGCPFSDRDWDEGYDIAYVLDGPPNLGLVSKCPTERKVTINASDPDGAPVPVRYRIDGGSWTTVMVLGSHDINMPTTTGYDYENHTVDAETNGVGPLGLPGTINRTASVRYGNPLSSTRACKDRDFTATPLAGPVSLSPNNEAPTDVTFSSNVTGTITPSGGPPKIKNIRFSRKFYIRRGPLVINITSPSPSPPHPRDVDAPLDAPIPDLGTISPTVQVGDMVCQTVTIKPTAGQIDTMGNIVNSNGVEQESPEACSGVYAMPYFRVYNSDVSAGFKECPGWSATTSSGTIKAWNKGTTSPGGGSGTQLAAFAINTIDGFSSANGRTSDPEPPYDLTFANTPVNPPYGSGFGAGFCAHDYFGTKPTGIPASAIPGSPLVLTSLPSGQTYYSGPVLATAGGNIATGKKITIYVDGDVFIAGDITYDSSWPNIDSIPNFTLVARGNIYIGNLVKNLSGVYIAQPNLAGSGGNIYTCVDPSQALPTPVGLYDLCKEQLTVHGAFIAKVVRLLRTGGTLANSDNNDGSGDPDAAEKFIFSPEAWLSSSILPATKQDTYDSITSIAPIL